MNLHTTSRCAVSVVMPCYNAATTVERAVESIAAQESAPLEVIAVNDASLDATPDVLRSLAAKSWPFDFRIVTLAMNAGPGEARNAGLACVAKSAAYIAFQDADDVWLPRKLTRQVGFMERHPSCGWTAHRCGVLGVGRESRQSAGGDSATRLSRRSLLFRNAVATPAVMARRDLPCQFRAGWRHCEDLMLWIDWIDAGYEGCMLEDTLAMLGRRPGTPGGSTDDRAAMHRGEQEVLRTLAAERRMGRWTSSLWAVYVRVRHGTRLLRRCA